MKIPEPIFKDNLPKISWKKIYDREYGVQYSEVAVSLLAFADYHFPVTTFAQIVIPGEGNNTAFYIDDISWVKLVEGLNNKYTANVKKLEEYEKQFLFDGESYLNIAKKIAGSDLKKLNNSELLDLFLEHQECRNKYSCFAWSAFILNNYVADKAIDILEPYIKLHKKEEQKQDIIDALFKPEKLAAVLQLQHEVQKHNEKLNEKQFEDLYERFKWLSCLDIQNNPWTKDEFREDIKSFTGQGKHKSLSFEEAIQLLKPSSKDLEYLKMAKGFVYIKDARDDYRRESVFYANALWEELGKRMSIPVEDTSYLLTDEIVNYLNNKETVDKEVIIKRKKGFGVYINENKKLVCLEGDMLQSVLQDFKLFAEGEKVDEITGRVASKGLAKGRVVIVKGVKDLNKVEQGSILVAVTTHPDYVPAMRKASAIVTDEGGITSHAAIVAREFGIPCIVGTKVATKILKDGDLVEVNADEGFVKKVN